MLQIAISALKLTFSNFMAICQGGALIAIALFLSTFAINLTVDRMLLNMNPQIGMLFELVAALLTSAFDVLAFLWITLCAHSVATKNQGLTFSGGIEKLFSNASLLIIEFLRGIASVIRWSLLFLLPGLIKQIGYLFIPFVIFFDSEYEAGNVDALERSKQLCYTIFFLLFAYFFFDLIIVMQLESGVTWSALSESPIQFSLSLMLFLIYQIFIAAFLYNAYSLVSQKLEQSTMAANPAQPANKESQ